MQSLFLNVSQRIILWNLVGNHNVPNLKEAATYLRLIEKLRLTDQETRDLSFQAEGQSMTWRAPSVGYGDKTFALEDGEAKALIDAMQSAPMRVADAFWMQQIVEHLESKKEEILPPAPTRPIIKAANSKDARGEANANA